MPEKNIHHRVTENTELEHYSIYDILCELRVSVVKNVFIFLGSFRQL